MTKTPLVDPALRFAAAAHRYRWYWFTFAILTLPVLVWYGSGLKTNRSLTSMFSQTDRVLVDYRGLQQTFGGNIVAMVVMEDDQWRTPNGLQRNREWTDSVESLDGVRGVLSVAKLEEAFRYLRPNVDLLQVSGESDPLIQSPLFDSADPLANEFLDLFSGYTHSAETSTIAIVAMIDPDAVSSAVGQLRRFSASVPPVHRPVLVGEPVLLEDAFDLIEADGRRLAIGTITLLSLVILLTLRDYRVILLGLLSILWSVALTRSFMVLSGIELSLVSTILTAIVTVIVVASVMHGGIRRVDMSSFRLIATLAVPIAWTCLTDAAGFLSLMVSDVQPVHQFGIMTAVAAMAVLVSLTLLSPSIFSLPTWPRPKPNAKHGSGPEWLKRLVDQTVQHRQVVGITSIVATIFCTIVVTGLSTKASFLDNFRSTSDIVLAYNRVESNLGGAGVWDIVLSVPPTLDANVLGSIRALESRLRKIELQVDGRTVALTKVLSLADAEAVASQSPILSFVPPEVRMLGMRSAIPTFAEALLTFDPNKPRQLRIMLRSNEGLSAKSKRELIRTVEATVQDWALNVDWKADSPPAVTGYYRLMSGLVDSLLRDQWWALGLALLSVGALLWIATRNLSITLVAVFANTLPVMLVLAIDGWLGNELDMGSAMIGAVSVGLSIDGSVHFLAGFLHRRKMQDVESAAIDAAVDLGQPIVLATVALVIGFGVLISSPFVPTSTFGTLVSVTLAASAVINLTVLPAMVVWVTPSKLPS